MAPAAQAMQTAIPVTPIAPAMPGAPATPVGSAVRDTTIDVLRGLSILAVAVGHWLVVVPTYSGGRFDGVNALAHVPLMHSLTWIFQVMPLFFVLGGFANGMSWRSARRKDVRYPDWLRTRLFRLVRPTTALLAVWIGTGAALRLVGIDAELVRMLAWLVVVPLWFLAVYVLVVALAPVMLMLHERFGLPVLLALAGMATLVDYVRLSTAIDGVEWTNFFWVFLFAQQLGFFWLDGRLVQRRWQPWALFLGGLGALYLLTSVGPYPVSLVGVPGEAIANNAPPTITLIALGIAQTGVGLLMRGRITRCLQRPSVAKGVVTLNLHAMTILLWHFTALVITAVVVLPLGIVPVYPDGSPAWWLVRVASVLVMTVTLVGLVALFGRIERRGLVGAPSVMPSASTGTPVVPKTSDALALTRVLLATGLFAASFSVITVRGLSDPASVLGLPVVAIALFTTASVLLGRDRPQRA